MTDGSPDNALADTGLATTRASEPRLPHGGKLGRYVIQGTLGSGGMGVVYRAQDPELGRLVALKVVRPGGGDGTHSQSRGRLVREAQAMARVSHPNVIVVHDAGSVGEDVYVAMELVTGVDLAVWQATPRGWRELVEVYLQAARGLAAAHRAGLVHRDFKPANTLVGNDGRVRVLDFGLARTIEDKLDELGETRPGSSAVTLTQTGAIMGTPQYMSPEQHLGERSDARTDQFSFCVALYQALYGRFPFAGGTYAELALSVTEGSPAAPPRGPVPAPIARVVMRGLAREPALRFGSMDELIAALEAALPRPRWHIVVPIAVAVIALAVTAFVLATRKPRAAESPALAFGRNQQSVTTSDEVIGGFDLSADGTRIAWTTATGIAFRDLTTGVTTERPEWRNITSLRWSLDGQSLLLGTDHGPEIFYPSGAEPRVFEQPVPEDPNTLVAWSPDQTTVLYHAKIAANDWLLFDVKTGSSRPLTITVPSNERVNDVDWSAAGIAFSTFNARNEASIWVVKADGSSQHHFPQDRHVGAVRWNAKGTRVYFTRTAEPGFEIAYQETSGGAPVMVLAQPQAELYENPSTFALARDESALFYLQRRDSEEIALRTLASGETRALTADRQRKRALTASRDGTLLAFAAGTETSKRLFILTRASGAIRELAVPPADIQNAAFSPDGHELAYSALEKGTGVVSIAAVSGTAPPRRLTLPQTDVVGLTWTSANQLLIAPARRDNLLVVDPATGEHHELFGSKIPDPYYSATSSDGTKVALTVPTGESSAALSVLHPPGSEPTMLSPMSSAAPFAWSADGAWVYSEEHPTDDVRQRLIATSASGDGSSRLLAVLPLGASPVLLDQDRSIAWISNSLTCDLWMASTTPRPPLAIGPPAPPRPPPTPNPFEPTPTNLALAGAPGTVPTGWEVSGTPTPGAISGECGRPGTCVVLDGASTGAVFQRVDAAPYKGHRVKLSFEARVGTHATLTVGIDSGIYARSEIPSGQLTMHAQAWERRELMADIAPDALYIEIKARATDGDRAYVANFALSPVNASAH